MCTLSSSARNSLLNNKCTSAMEEIINQSHVVLMGSLYCDVSYLLSVFTGHIYYTTTKGQFRHCSGMNLVFTLFLFNLFNGLFCLSDIYFSLNCMYSFLYIYRFEGSKCAFWTLYMTGLMLLHQFQLPRQLDTGEETKQKVDADLAETRSCR